MTEKYDVIVAAAGYNGLASGACINKLIAPNEKRRNILWKRRKTNGRCEL